MDKFFPGELDLDSTTRGALSDFRGDHCHTKEEQKGKKASEKFPVIPNRVAIVCLHLVLWCCGAGLLGG